jgi:hypothetical protein
MSLSQEMSLDDGTAVAKNIDPAGYRARRGSMPMVRHATERRMSYQGLGSIESFLANPPKEEPKIKVRDSRSLSLALSPYTPAAHAALSPAQ